MKPLRRHKKMTALCIMLLAVIGAGTLRAGDLNPPAPPTAGTMKPLDQVEPRIPIPASATPADVFTINHPGSYYLTGDRHCNDTGIQVNVDNVTIDLQGYALISSNPTGGWGISIEQRSNVEIRNGTVRGFLAGVSEGYSTAASNNRVINVRAMSNRIYGLYLRGTGVLIKDCTVGGSEGSGIYAGKGSTITGCLVTGNGNSYDSSVFGIQAGNGSTVTGNTVSSNGISAAGLVYGIEAGYAGTVTGNTVSENGLYANSDVYGIWTSGGSTVAQNTVTFNGEAAGGTVQGIRAGDGSVIRSNTADSNGVSGKGYVYGFYCSQTSTVIGNTAHHNGAYASGSVWGIWLGGYNLVDQNTAVSNGTGASPAVNMNAGIVGCVYGINVAP